MNGSGVQAGRSGTCIDCWTFLHTHLCRQRHVDVDGLAVQQLIARCQRSHLDLQVACALCEQPAAISVCCRCSSHPDVQLMFTHRALQKLLYMLCLCFVLQKPTQVDNRVHRVRAPPARRCGRSPPGGTGCAPTGCTPAPPACPAPTAASPAPRSGPGTQVMNDQPWRSSYDRFSMTGYYY